MFKLTKFLKGYRREAIFGPIFKLLEAVLELIVPLVMAKIIDVGITGGDAPYIWRMGGLMVLLGVVGLLSALTCQYLAARASQGFGTAVRRNLYAHINTLSYTELDRFETSSLITRLTSDVNQAQTAVAMTIRLAVRVPFLIIGSTVMAIVIDPKLSLIYVAAAVVVAAILFLIMRFSVPKYTEVQKKLDKVSSVTRENLEGARVIRAFSREDGERRRFHCASENLKSISVKVGRISTLMNPLTTVVINLAIVVLILLGAQAVNIGGLTQGNLIALVNYLTQILLALIVLANLVVMYTKSVASAARINEVFALESSVKDGQSQQPAERCAAASVTFENVSFTYGKAAEPALSNLSIDICAGETVGIIGGTGSGKSTLVNLICRFYDVTEGRIMIDGEDVRHFTPDALRRKIGIVPQRAQLFSGTIAENLTMGRDWVTKEDIAFALDVSQSREFVENLTDGINSVVEQGGKNFSGGQRQRLTIARAVAMRPSILILDDSASALDFATDAKLRKALRENTEDMTVITVSQRVGTVMSADRIIVLDEGNVVGIGTHQELLSSCGEYAEICRSQLSEEECGQ